jgi:hypothetical protein
MFKPSLENIIGSLSIGKTPVVQCPSPHNELHCSDSLKMPYVAISHVWVNGLGSTTEEGLLTCQIKRLVALTNQWTPGRTFWIDALCVPSLKDMRKQVIRLMAKSYKDAKFVSVIDFGIRATSRFAPIEENCTCCVEDGCNNFGLSKKGFWLKS